MFTKTGESVTHDALDNFCIDDGSRVILVLHITHSPSSLAHLLSFSEGSVVLLSIFMIDWMVAELSLDSGESKSDSGNLLIKCTYTTWYDLLTPSTESFDFNG